MLRPCNQNIRHTIDLAQEMITLADQGDADREDIGCGILYGVLRDAGYKLLRLAQQEKERHQKKGWWAPPVGFSSSNEENVLGTLSTNRRKEST